MNIFKRNEVATTGQKPQASRQRWLFAFIFSFVFLLTLACDNLGALNWGTKKTFKGFEVYYTSAVTEKEADKLGAWLIANEWADGEEKTAQLTKTGKTYEVKMVVKKGIEQDQEFIDAFKALAIHLKFEVFDGQAVDIHLCDDWLKTLRVVPSMY